MDRGGTGDPQNNGAFAVFCGTDGGKIFHQRHCRNSGGVEMGDLLTARIEFPEFRVFAVGSVMGDLEFYPGLFDGELFVKFFAELAPFDGKAAFVPVVGSCGNGDLDGGPCRGGTFPRDPAVSGRKYIGGIGVTFNVIYLLCR